eukprot:83011-Chlamydomonas_euryale.AAC.2
MCCCRCEVACHRVACGCLFCSADAFVSVRAPSTQQATVRCLPNVCQAAKLLAAFREFKRREACGLVPFYSNRLAALEDALLAARERLFAVSADESVNEAEVLRQEPLPNRFPRNHPACGFECVAACRGRPQCSSLEKIAGQHFGDDRSAEQCRVREPWWDIGASVVYWSTHGPGKGALGPGKGALGPGQGALEPGKGALGPGKESPARSSACLRTSCLRTWI